MENNYSTTIMHIDVNSAFLSWQAAYNKQIGIEKDIRDIPAVIGGNEEKRHGIVLAKSILAKKAGIKTGESLMEARTKCKNLTIIPPNYDLYVKSSKALISLLKEYSPNIAVFSIDECFLDYKGMEKYFGNDPVKVAYTIRDRIQDELGFTVNIGISTNKLLAKQASELEKPNRVHTIYPNEIKEKLWSLDVGELFMVGSRTKPKLNKLGIYTIGDLANSDYNFISTKFKSHGRLIYNYAWGRDDSSFNRQDYIPFKSVGNGSTIHFDVDDKETAYKILLSLVETTTKRLRQSNMQCGVIAVSIKNTDLIRSRHQRKLLSFSNSTTEVYEITKELFDEMWCGNPIRQFNVRLSDIISEDVTQITIFDNRNLEKLKRIDKTIDSIREKYGNKAITRATFLNSGLKSMLGGFPKEEYPAMSSIL